MDSTWKLLMLSTHDSLWNPYKVGVLIISESRLVICSWETLYIQAILWAAALIRPDFRKTVFTLACPGITPSPSTTAFSYLCNLNSPCSVPRAASAHASTSSSRHPLPHSLLNNSWLFLLHLPSGTIHLPLTSFPVPFYTNWKKVWFANLLMGLKLLDHVGWPAGRQNTSSNSLIHAETLPSFGVFI